MGTPAHETRDHDAQRELEHRALRNVRGLVDRIEADEQARGHSQKWIVAVLVAVVAAGAVLIAIALLGGGEGGREIAIPPVPRAPAR
jgi:hypothetical protein